EVLAVALQQLSDQPKIAKMLMRTVIMSLNAWEGLRGFVCNTVLMKMVGKRVWGAEKMVWEGFVRVLT
ncbi:hypothetical protein HK097_002270, partial [Rhizophlyctis rosea]